MATNNSINAANPITVTEGGTGLSTATTAYGVVCAGTTATGALQVLSALGASGTVLTSNGASALPSFQAAAGGGITTLAGDSGTATGSTVTLNANSNSGSSVTFSATSATVSLKVTDSHSNVIIGASAGNGSVSGSHNIGVGPFTLTTLSSGSSNTAVGYASLNTVATTSNNTAVGISSGTKITGSDNTIVGKSAMLAAGNASFNTAIGSGALAAGSSGTPTFQYNTAIGYNAGSSYTTSEGSNICINSTGTIGESNVLRIGSATGTSTQNINAAYICGITGITVTGTAVLISSGNQLGIAVSSRRYKENIQDMGNLSNDIFKLRPVSFNYTVGDDRSQQIGLIAEEVEEIMPSLCAYDGDGIIQAVKYHELPVLLLNEIQKLKKEIEELKARI